MSEITVFYLISSKFLVDLFLGTSYFFPHIPNKNPPAYYSFDFLDLIIDFFTLFRPKRIFLDLKKFFYTF